MRPMLFASVFLFLLSLGFAACNGNAKIYVPAVVENGGSLVEISVALSPGAGDIYLTIYPRSAVSTQISADDAVAYAFEAADESMRGCDVRIKIASGSSASYVEGPSAGIALSVITYAALKNLPVLEDATITGAIGPQHGDIERVGGVYEKALAAAKNRMRYFVMPVANVHERVLLMPIQNSYNMEIIEITHTDDAIDFLVHGIRPPPVELLAENRSIPSGIANISHPSMEAFRPLAEAMMAHTQRSVEQLPQRTTEQQSIQRFYRSGETRQQFLLDYGYTFTAANEAFLDFIDIQTLLASQDISSLDLDAKKQEIATCLNALEDVPKTEANMEWAIGADLRKAWALERLQSIDTSRGNLAEEKYLLFNQLEYGEAWCFVSEQLRRLAPQAPSSPVDEMRFRTLALASVEQAEALPFLSRDVQEHIASSRLLYAEGKYAAAMYDATFALSFYKAQEDLASFSDAEIAQRTAERRDADYSSLWARVYQSHARYLQEDGNDYGVVYPILVFADALNTTQAQLRATAPAPSPSPLSHSVTAPITQVPVPTYRGPSQCFPAYIFAILSLSVVMLWRR